MNSLLHLRFARQAQATPRATALLQQARAIDYAKLQERVLRTAAALHERGIGPGALVALHLERSIEQVAAQLAILHCGAAVLPLPPSWPAARRAEVLAFAQASAVIDGPGSRLDPALHAGIHCCEQLAAREAANVVAAAADPQAVAFVLSSSGSTGTPKLIARSHASFFHRLEWTWREHPFANDERCCQKAHMTTTHALYELFEPLLAGTATCILADEEARNLEQFWDTLREQGITRALLVPSALQATLAMPDFRAPALRVLVLMGEHLDARLAGRALEAFPAPARLYSIYGSTEASSTLVCELRTAWRAGAPLPLGTPIDPSVRAVVLDEQRAVVAPGASGRLHIGGAALFAGYLHDPVQTAAVLVEAADGSGPLYDTRDQVRVAGDGALQFLGRVDDTVKIRGFRVDLQEVEGVLRACPGVRQAAVVCAEDGGTQRLLAFHAPQAPSGTQLFAALRARLPAYMVPSELHARAELPLTASGKIDRRRLLAELEARHDTGGPRDDLASETERRIAAAWSAQLGHADFSREDSFFEIGGSSLSAFAVVQGLRDAFALDRNALPGQLLYEYPSIAALAARLATIERGEAAAPDASAADPLVSLKRGTDAGLAPLFLVSSAGGALGSYDRLVQALQTTRAVLGLRDPFLWGERDATRGFSHWVDGYVRSIRARQPHGPYYLCAYSSAGAFGFEIACRLREQGETIALLALIDPIGIDLRSRRRFGYWAMEARFMRAPKRALVRLAGWLRACRPRRAGEALPHDEAPAAAELDSMTARLPGNRALVLGFAQLMQLNSGQPFALDEAERRAAEPAAYLAAFLARVQRVAPAVDTALIERMLLQYPLQVRAQNAYRLRFLDATVDVFEPAGPGSGLVAALLRPWVAKLRARALPLDLKAGEPHPLDEAFPRKLRSHYLCMRDEQFIAALARELGAALTTDR